MADSSPSVWPTTSPSRWMAASTSPRAQGTTSSTTRSDPRRRSPSTRRSSSTPSPVRAETSTDPSMAAPAPWPLGGDGRPCSPRPARARRPRRSRRAPSRTAAIWASAFAAVPSTTWTRRSARRTESRVERKASTSSWGSLRTKPTVSVTSTVSPPGRESWRVRGSRVTKRRFSAGTPASVQAVEQGRLAGVGVAHQRQLTVAAAGPAAALQRPGALDLAQVGLQPVHAPHQAAAVHLELGLARAPGPDATGLLAEGRAPAPQAGQPVAQEGQLHLGLALGAAGVLGEDVEDHRRAVDGGAPEQLLQVAVLGRRQLVVEDDRVGIEAAAQRGDLLRLAPPDERGRVGGVAPLHDAAHDVGAGAVHQLRQLVELLLDHLGWSGRERPRRPG